MYKKSLKINEELRRKEGMANSYGNLGNVHQIRGELEQAEEMYKKGLDLYKEIGAKQQADKVESLSKKLQIFKFWFNKKTKW